MELRHLRYFVAVAEELHFSRAAAKLHVSQPPLSQQIKALEGELGVELFTRSRQKVALTEAGRQYLVEAHAILAHVERAAEKARRAARGEFGELSLGFTGSFPFLPVMPRIIQGFRHAYPHVQVVFRELSTAVQIEAVADGTLDVGFVRPRSVDAPGAVELVHLATEPLVVVLHRTHPLAARRAIAIRDLAGEPFILYAQRLGTGFTEQVMELCRGAGFRPRVVQEVEEMPTIIGLVCAGVGVSIVSASMRRIRLPEVVYRPLREKRARAAFFLAFRRETHSAIVRNFVGHVRAAVAGTRNCYAAAQTPRSEGGQEGS